MKFDLTTPCNDCPFRRGDGCVRVRPARAALIADCVLESMGRSFACHKTKHLRPNARSHCAGALVFAAKHDHPSSLLQICARMDMYDPTKLRGHDEVFDTRAEMLAAHAEREPV